MPALPKRIGVLTGGGDCPGLNAVIRAVTKSAIWRGGIEVIGIEDGFLGLIEDRCRRLTDVDVSGILATGGTILGANNKIDPARYPVDRDGKTEFVDMTDRCVENLRRRRIDALVVIGGDGTMTVAASFVKRGVNCIGLPKTIDNDLHGTDVTFGFASAVAVATDALDRVHTTAASHHRVMVVEVMGRNAGWLALHAGIASGSDIILIPELPYDLEVVCQKIRQRSQHGKRYSIVCAAEGARPIGGQQVVDRYDPNLPEPVRLGGVGRVIAHQIEGHTGIETRFTVLGYTQRGGSPVPQDRVLATEFGCAAVEMLLTGQHNRLVVMKGRTLSHIDILEAAGRQRLVPTDHPLIHAARCVGTSFGV
ncbi:MAG TPA: ATP-dependent 6-phosphofructokinase, partial [Phycisphaeraceae bacterium]